MGFKKIDARKHRTRSVSSYPQVSISKSRIYLNASAADKLGEHVKKVDVLFDDENNRLGIRAAEEENHTAFTLAQNNKYKGRNINSQSMIRGIKGDEYNKTQKYVAEWNEEEKMLVINLDSPV